MTDSVMSAEGKLRTAFTAARPSKQLAAAQSFIDTIRDLSETGAKPTSATLKTGETILKKLEEQSEVYLFQAAVLAGQEAGSAQDLARKVETIGRDAETVENTSRQLRQVLKTFA